MFDFQYSFKTNRILWIFIGINLALFILINLMGVVAYLSGSNPSLVGESIFTKWFAVPTIFSALIVKPWTIFTYMFYHEGFLHFFFNMWMLYFGGTLFMQFLNAKKFVTAYIIGGLFGYLIYFVSYNIFPVFQEVKHVSLLLGASAAVLAVLVTICSYKPDTVIQLFLFGRVKLRYLALILVAVDVLTLDNGNPGGHISHIGGALFGFIYGTSLRKGFKFINFGFLKPTMKTKFKVHYNKPITDEEYNEKRNIKQKEIDIILDKIAKRGYESLSKEEKDILFKESKKL